MKQLRKKAAAVLLLIVLCCCFSGSAYASRYKYIVNVSGKQMQQVLKSHSIPFSYCSKIKWNKRKISITGKMDKVEGWKNGFGKRQKYATTKLRIASNVKYSVTDISEATKRTKVSRQYFNDYLKNVCNLQENQISVLTIYMKNERAVRMEITKPAALDEVWLF